MLGPSNHDCLLLTDELLSSSPVLRITPLTYSVYTLLIDGSSYVSNGVHQAVYAVITLDKVILAKALTQGWYTQQTELLAKTDLSQLCSASSNHCAGTSIPKANSGFRVCVTDSKLWHIDRLH